MSPIATSIEHFPLILEAMGVTYADNDRLVIHEYQTEKKCTSCLIHYETKRPYIVKWGRRWHLDTFVKTGLV